MTSTILPKSGDCETPIAFFSNFDILIPKKSQFLEIIFHFFNRHHIQKFAFLDLSYNLSHTENHLRDIHWE